MNFLCFRWAFNLSAWLVESQLALRALREAKGVMVAMINDPKHITHMNGSVGAQCIVGEH